MFENNLKAFLDTISFSEGTYGKGDNGYNVLVGGTLFEGYADHPRKKVYLPKLGIYSTAAGRYQLLARYFDAYKKQLKLPDFSPSSQDAVAVQQIRERKALEPLAQGDFNGAAALCAPIWASFPGAGYGQHEHPLKRLQEAFIRFGGVMS